MANKKATPQDGAAVLGGVTFDVNQITHVAWLGHLKATTVGPKWTAAAHFASWYAVFMQVITKCPWGNPKQPATYKKMPQFGGWEMLMDAFNVACAEARQTPVLDGVVFDLSVITHADWVAHAQATLMGLNTPQEQHYAAWYTMFGKVLTPGAWGDPADVKTYQKMPQFGGFEALIEGFNLAVENERKKVRTPSTTS